jgi:methionyl-tRNA formyltransferase
VATGGAHVQLLDVQLEGKKMMAAEDFANGMQHFIGSVLGT